MTPEQIIARDFAVTTGAHNVSVRFDDETIIVIADGVTWIMEIGSDDKAFIFQHGDQQVVVPFSNNYLASIQ